MSDSTKHASNNVNHPLGTLSVDHFLKEYWQKQPLVIRQGLPNIKPPITADELAGLSLEEDVESRILQEMGPREPWELWNGPMSESIFRRLPDDKPWTLLVQAVDHWVPSVFELKSLFEFIPSWRIDDIMISYANKGGSVGPHYDHYDVFLIQVQGIRQWQIGKTCSEEDPLIEGPKVRILEQFESVQQYEMHPGDILYLPPKIAHYGPALTNDCMTISVGFKAPSHSEMFNDFSRYLGDELSDFVRYQDPDLVAQPHPAEITQASLARAKQIFLDYVNDDQRFGDWFGRLMTEQKYPELEPPIEGLVRYESLEQDLANTDYLSLDESCRLAFVKDKALKVFIDGESYRLENRLEPIIIKLSQEKRLSVDFIMPLLGDEAVRILLVDWINRQKLLLTP
jgi:50S ribosomal protein L16 3-hydroxylase